MDKLQIIILISLISISTFAWIISKDQPDMMKAMMKKYGVDNRFYKFK
jgi:hypothetical protein